MILSLLSGVLQHKRVLMIGMVVLLIGVTVSIAKQNGALKGQVSQLTKHVYEWQRHYEALKQVSIISNQVIADIEAEKQTLRRQHQRLQINLEELKRENSDIREWAHRLVPDRLAERLLRATDRDNTTGSTSSPATFDAGHPRTHIEVPNENLYTYASELKTALQSCNQDKRGLREWVAQVNRLYSIDE